MPSYTPGKIYPLVETPKLEYRRPSDWLKMPEVLPSEEKFVGLFAVYNHGSNFISLSFTDDYVVDWGDGNIENYSSGVTAEHIYDYDDIPAHTLTSKGYRQVIVTVQPQPGNSLRDLDLVVRHSSQPSVYDLSSFWLDIVISMPQGESLYIGNSGSNVPASLEVARIVNSGNCTSLYELFYEFPSLREFTGDNLPLVDDIGSMFYQCPSLRKVKLPDIPNLSYHSDIFYECTALKTVEMGDISNAGDIDYMFDAYLYFLESVHIKKAPSSVYETFSECYSLKKVTIEDPSLIEDFSYAFYNCFTLESFSLGDTPLLEDCGDMFSYCYSLRHVSFSDLSSLTDASDMFYECFSLAEVNLPAMPLLSSTSYMFYHCYSLRDVTLQGSVNLNPYYMFYECYGLKTARILETLPGADVGGTFYYNESLADAYVGGQPGYLNDCFYNCYSLRKAEFEDCSQVTSAPGAFSGCSQLTTVSIPGMPVSVNLSNGLLSRNAIVNVFNDLATIVTPETIDVSGNWGAADLTSTDVDIAENKGWTVIY